MSKGYIEIESTKGIKGPIKTKMEIDADKIYWNIKFNIALNPATVNEDNMDVTDVEGFILTSYITYNAANNAIVISPREPYKPNATYILNISTDVCSKGNNNLKEEVQIVFRLKGSEISNFKILKGPERLDIDIKPSKYAPTPAQMKKDKLPMINPSINFWVAAGALIVFFIAVLTKSFVMMVVGLGLLISGIAHIIYQYTNKTAASIRNYNKGASCYNNAEYGDAATYFDLALMQNPSNIFAKRGQDRLSSASAYQKSMAP